MPRLCVARISRLVISIVLIALGVTQTAPVEVNAAGESWFSSSWLLRKAITIDATKVSSGPHTDFPCPHQPLLRLQPGGSQRPSRRRRHSFYLLWRRHPVEPRDRDIWQRYRSIGGGEGHQPSSATDTVLFMYYGNGPPPVSRPPPTSGTPTTGGLPPEGESCGCRARTE